MDTLMVILLYAIAICLTILAGFAVAHRRWSKQIEERREAQRRWEEEEKEKQKKAAERRKQREREAHEAFHYSAILECTNCGDRSYFDIRKGVSIESHARNISCKKCGVRGTYSKAYKIFRYNKLL